MAFLLLVGLDRVKGSPSEACGGGRVLRRVSREQNFSCRSCVPSFSLAFFSSAGSRGFSGSFSSTGVSSSLTATFDFLFSAFGFGSFFSFFFSVAAGSLGEVSLSFVVLAGCTLVSLGQSWRIAATHLLVVV